MKIKTNSHPSPLLPISLLALVPSLVFGAGLAAIKEQSFHQDAGASVVAYSALSESGMSVKIETANRTFTIEPKNLAGKLEVISTLPVNITTETELSPVRKAAKDYRDFSTRFPKSAAILANHIAALDTCIKEFEGGKARYNGKWMPREEALMAIQKQEQAILEKAAARKRKYEEERAFVNSQKAKGLVMYDGKWISEDEARKLAARDKAGGDKSSNISPSNGLIKVADVLLNESDYPVFEKRWYAQHDADLANIFPSAKDSATRIKNFKLVTLSGYGGVDALSKAIQTLGEENNAKLFEEQGDLEATDKRKNEAARNRNIVVHKIREGLSEDNKRYAAQAKKCFDLINSLLLSGLSPLVDTVEDAKRREVRWINVDLAGPKSPDENSVNIITGRFIIKQVISDGCLGNFWGSPNGYSFCFMKGLVAENSLFEGAVVVVECYRSDVYPYTSLLGSKTVPKYQTIRWRP